MVRTTSGPYVPRSVTIVVTRSAGVISNVGLVASEFREPGQVPASYRASNFNVSQATQNGFLRSPAARARPRVPTLLTTAPSRRTLSAPTSAHEARARREAPSESGTADAGTPASERAFAIVRPSKRGPDSST